MHTSAKAALGTFTNLAAKCKVLPEDSEYIEIKEDSLCFVALTSYDIKRSCHINMATPFS